MAKTSTEVKRRYNDKTYKRWFADIRNDDFEQLEQMRGDQSRAAFLKMLVDFYTANKEKSEE